MYNNWNFKKCERSSIILKIHFSSAPHFSQQDILTVTFFQPFGMSPVSNTEWLRHVGPISRLCTVSSFSHPALSGTTLSSYVFLIGLVFPLYTLIYDFLIWLLWFFFLPPKWISFFSHSRWETEGRRNAPSCARCVPEPGVGLRYVRRLFVFSHLFCVCVEFFIPLGFALFPLLRNNQNPVWKVQTLVVISMPQMLAWENTQCRRFTAGSPHLWGPRVMAAVTESKSWSLST